MTIAADDDTDRVFPGPQIPSKGGLYGALVDTTGLDPNIVAVLHGTAWTQNYTNGQLADSQPASLMTYWFPQQSSDYGNYSTPSASVLNVQKLSPTQQTATITGLDLVESYTSLKFTPATSSDTAALRFAALLPGALDPSDGNKPISSNAGYPPQPGKNADNAGDDFLASSNGLVSSKYFGEDGFLTIIHEFGHALGLKHGHEPNPPEYGLSGNGVLAPQFDDNEFSVMTYRSYFGSPNDSLPTSAVNGSSPQSFMMFDIAALQVMYGANFDKLGTAALYSWDPTTGQELLNGMPAPDTGATATQKIFSTVWTQAATSTYDLSGFTQDQVDNMQPGKWMTFSNGQLAQLNSAAVSTDDDGHTVYNGPLAQGNIYNALLYNNDKQSEINNLKTGIGNDLITGNDKGNHIDAGAGADVIRGGSGDDFITGGPGHDVIDTGHGYDTLTDTSANMNGDSVSDFSQYLAVQYLGIRVGFSHINIIPDGISTNFLVDGSNLALNGNPTGGAYYDDQRGTTADTMNTTVKFVPYLPSLQEGVAVSSDSINGIIDRSFLTGDGNVHFTGTLQQSSTSFHNEVGVYQIGPDGTISNVHILFADALNPGNPNFDLGTLGNGVQQGFFLVQNGFNAFGALPNDLSFIAQGSPLAANVNLGQTLQLHSASLGNLNAVVFFSSSQLNPGGFTQVLSGTDASGKDLTIGFEDMPFNSSDKDFQDVVLHIHNNADMLYGV